mgnify:CR=1 FL=1
MINLLSKEYLYEKDFNTNSLPYVFGRKRNICRRI